MQLKSFITSTMRGRTTSIPSLGENGQFRINPLNTMYGAYTCAHVGVGQGGGVLIAGTAGAWWGRERGFAPDAR